MNDSPASSTLRVSFDHGLGDCVYFAHQLPLYLRRGFDVEVCCAPDKAILFEAAGVRVCANRRGAAPVPWFEGEEPSEHLTADNYWYWSKMARNLSLPPMPDLGNPRSLWDEYCEVALNTDDLIPDPTGRAVEAYVDSLGAPIIVLHSQGVTSGERKDIPPAVLREICCELLSTTVGVILLLDEDPGFPPMPHWRVRQLRDDFGPMDVAGLLALLGRADLIIGVDSGPLHLARYTKTPTLGLWMGNGSPASWALPRAIQANIVVGKRSRRWTANARLPFNLIECDGPEDLAGLVGRTSMRMLAGSRYLPKGHLGRDVLLQHVVRDGQGGGDNAFGGVNDRDQGFDYLLREAARRFEHPLIVETGTMCEADDAIDAGGSTLILGLFAASCGTLMSIDHDVQTCAFARGTVACLGECIEVITADAIAWLAADARPIDVLHLDSCQTARPGGAVHVLQETRAAFSRLHPRSLVAFDDTGYLNGGFIGSGALSVPWLLEQGWRVVFSGHQTIVSPTVR